MVKSAIRIAFAADPIVNFGELPDKVRASLSMDELNNLGSVSWYTTTVKLDMGARRVTERIPGSRPQVLRLVRRNDDRSLFLGWQRPIIDCLP